MRTGEAAPQRVHRIRYLLTARAGMSPVWLAPWLLVFRVPQHPLHLWALASSQRWREATGTKELRTVKRGGFLGSTGVWSPQGDDLGSPPPIRVLTCTGLHVTIGTPSAPTSVPDTPGSGAGSGRAGVRSMEDVQCTRPGSKSQLCPERQSGRTGGCWLFTPCPNLLVCTVGAISLNARAVPRVKRLNVRKALGTAQGTYNMCLPTDAPQTPPVPQGGLVITPTAPSLPPPPRK